MEVLFHRDDHTIRLLKRAPVQKQTETNSNRSLSKDCISQLTNDPLDFYATSASYLPPARGYFSHSTFNPHSAHQLSSEKKKKTKKTSSLIVPVVHAQQLKPVGELGDLTPLRRCRISCLGNYLAASFAHVSCALSSVGIPP